MAENQRTATKARIKRATAKAQVAVAQQDVEARRQLTLLYQQAQSQIEETIRSHGDQTGTLRLVSLRDLLREIEQRLTELRQQRDQLLDAHLREAVTSGALPFIGVVGDVTRLRTIEQVLLHVRHFVAEDGLQLSDRLWRLDRHAREVVGQAVETAIIQGHSASQAAEEFLSRGQPVHMEVASKAGMAKADRVAKVAGSRLMTEEGQRSPYDNALRVFRTEINRAHGEAYMANAEATPGFAGIRFLLSPAHPKPDICDMHAHANLYGLGPGVYPSRAKCPWPAHPNTLSFTEIVFDDEVSAEDKAGKEDRLSWLQQQPAARQEAVLGSRAKRQAFEQGILTEGEIATPWKVLKKKYERKGIQIAD